MARSWPLTTFIADFTAGPPNVPGSGAVDLQAGKTALRQVSTQRGRQYELGVVQAGTMTVDLTDTSEYLNPVNTGSPWNSGGNTLLPYRTTQFGAWWNQATKNTAGNWLNSTNLITGSTSARYDPSFESSTGGFFAYVGAPTVATSTVQKFDGAQSLAVGFTAATDAALMALPSPLTPGRTYTLTVYVFVPAGVTATASFLNFASTVGSTIAAATSSTTGAWQRLTMTGVVAGPFTVVQVKAAGTFPATVYIDAVQLELASAASAFSVSGPTFNPVFTGYVERYPQKWDSAGFRGIKPLTAVDALSPLSRTKISQSYAQTIAADNPQVYIPYNDLSFPQAVQRPTGGQQMIGYTQLGSNSGAVNFAGDTFLDGSKAVTVSQQNTSPTTFNDNTQLTFLGTRQGSLSMNPQSFTLEMWIKWNSGVIYGGAGAMQPGESTVGEYNGPAKAVKIYTFNGALTWGFADPNGGSTVFFNVRAPGLFPDGQWHHIALVFLGSNNFKSIIDGFSNPIHAFTFTPSVSASLNNFFLEASTYYGDPVAAVSAASWAAYAQPLSDATVNAHYQRGIGYLGEKSGTRANRLLTKYWPGTITTDTGKTAMAPDFSYNGRGVLDVLQEIATTEGGLCWVAAAGTVHQDSREARYVNAPTSQFTFGENTAAGELPYVAVEYDFDPTYVYSEADLTAASGTVYKNVNTASQTAYGQRILSTTMQMANDWDVGQAAAFYTQRYAKPAGAAGTNTPPRIAKFTIDPAANPNLWQAALSLDIGDRITAKRRTSPGVTITGDYYIEQVSHNVNADASTWTVDYQLSPVFNPQVWKLGDATLGALGTTSICVY